MPPPGRHELRGIYHISSSQAELENKHTKSSRAHRLLYILAGPDAQEHLAWGLTEFTFRTGVSERERERERFTTLASGRIRPDCPTIAFILTLGFLHIEYAPVSWRTVISIPRSVIVKSLVQRPHILHCEHYETQSVCTLCYFLFVLSELYASLVFTVYFNKRDRQYTYVYKRSIEVHSCNHCCSGNAVSVACSECMFVALVNQHAMRVWHIVICGLNGLTLFFHIISQRARLSGKRYWT